MKVDLAEVDSEPPGLFTWDVLMSASYHWYKHWADDIQMTTTSYEGDFALTWDKTKKKRAAIETEDPIHAEEKYPVDTQQGSWVLGALWEMPVPLYTNLHRLLSWRSKVLVWYEFKLCLISHEWVTSLSACVWRN